MKEKSVTIKENEYEETWFQWLDVFLFVEL